MLNTYVSQYGSGRTFSIIEELDIWSDAYAADMSTGSYHDPVPDNPSGITAESWHDPALMIDHKHRVMPRPGTNASAYKYKTPFPLRTAMNSTLFMAPGWEEGRRIFGIIF
jgi:hypothetical protein